MFNIPSDFRTSDFASIRPADNLSLNDAKYLASISEALGLGKREIIIGWNSGLSQEAISVEDFIARGGDQNVPIDIYLRHSSQITGGDNAGAQSVVLAGTLAAEIARQFNAGTWQGFVALAAPVMQGDKSQGQALLCAVDKVPGVGDAIKSRIQEVVGGVRRR